MCARRKCFPFVAAHLYRVSAAVSAQLCAPCSPLLLAPCLLLLLLRLLLQQSALGPFGNKSQVIGAWCHNAIIRQTRDTQGLLYMLWHIGDGREAGRWMEAQVGVPEGRAQYPALAQWHAP